MYCIFMKLFDLSPPVYSWSSGKLPFECQKNCQKFSSFFFKKLKFLAILKKVKFLAVFWHSNGNYPEGQVYSITTECLNEWKCGYHSKMIYGQKKMLFSRIWTLCQSSTKLSMLLTILIIRNAWLNHVSRCKNPFLSVREFVCVSCLFEVPPSALDTWMWSEFSPLDLVN